MKSKKRLKDIQSQKKTRDFIDHIYICTQEIILLNDLVKIVTCEDHISRLVLPRSDCFFFFTNASSNCKHKHSKSKKNSFVLLRTNTHYSIKFGTCYIMTATKCLGCGAFGCEPSCQAAWLKISAPN